MNNRKNNRFTITLHARITVGSKSYEGSIVNMSQEGLASTITTCIKTDNDFHPEKTITVDFVLPSGEPITMHGNIRWFINPSEKKETLMLGLYVEDPPSKYTEWISRFQSKRPATQQE